MAQEATTAAGKILHNSFWYGLEQVLETVIFFGTSIAVARRFGPDMLGHFSYINFFVTIVTRTSGTGLASATRKYMSEYLGLDRPGTARAVYNLAFRYQLLASVFITLLGLAGVLLSDDHTFRAMSIVMILSIVPGVMSWVPAQANQAFEDVYENTLSAFGYLLTYAVIIVLTLSFGWGLVGIAAAQLIGRTAEVFLRTIPLHRRLRRLPLDVLPHDVALRIRDFCVQAVGIQLLMSIVWDRSELLFLKYFAPWVMKNGVREQDLTQLGFYSVSFTLANNLLVIPRAFSSAAGITLMVQSVRDPGRIDSILANTCRYLLLVVFPVHLGAAAIAAQLLALAYGNRYIGAIPVVIVAAILSIPRAFQELAEVLLRAADRQKLILIWFTVTGVVNVALDWYLIPRFGAVGAAWGNGLSQTFGILAIWVQARRAYEFSFPFAVGARLLLAGLLMALATLFTVRTLPLTQYANHTAASSLRLAGAIVLAALLYGLLVKGLRGLEASDRERLAPIAGRLPGPVKRWYLAVLSFVAPGYTDRLAG